VDRPDQPVASVDPVRPAVDFQARGQPVRADLGPGAAMVAAATAARDLAAPEQDLVDHVPADSADHAPEAGSAVHGLAAPT
jgi:hypothetical protein